jgi:hypothetical protein
MRTKRNWGIYNRRSVEKGDITLYIDPAILNNKEDIKRMNKGKVGRPYKYSAGLILATFAVKCLFRLGYRRAEGFMKGMARKLGITSNPVYTEVHDRISKLKKKDIDLNVRPLGIGEKRNISIDSTGIKEINGGEYRNYKYGGRKGWIKLHASVDNKTKEILTDEITKENVHDMTQHNNLIDPVKDDLDSAYLDRAYDAEQSFKHAKENGYKCNVPVRINASTKCGPFRREAVREQFGLPFGKQSHNRFFKHGRIENWKKRQQKKWKERVHYGDRWIIEGTFARFKGYFGEYVFSKKRIMKKKELLLKIGIYNSIIVAP